MSRRRRDAAPGRGRWGRAGPGGFAAGTVLAGALLAGLLIAAPAGAQSLEDFDYENLEFRGVGVRGAGIFPTTVESAGSWGVDFDLGYLGPGLRILPSVTWWSSELEGGEVEELETKLEETIRRQDPGPGIPTVDLGRIDWESLALTVDAQVVWRTPLDLLTYAGLGAGAHFLNGSGDAIDDTFVEDLLDRVSPAVNAHLGAEYVLGRRLRLHVTGRYTVLEDVRYAEAGGGLRFMFGGPAPGETDPTEGPSAP